MASETRQDAILGLMDAGVGSAPTVDATVGLHADCRACGTFAGPPDVAALQARVALLEGLLREMQWGGVLDYSTDPLPACPECDEPQISGHRPDCRLAAALADGG